MSFKLIFNKKTATQASFFYFLRVLVVQGPKFKLGFFVVCGVSKTCAVLVAVVRDWGGKRAALATFAVVCALLFGTPPAAEIAAFEKGGRVR